MYLTVAAIGVKRQLEEHLGQSIGLLFAIVAAFALPHLPIFQLRELRAGECCCKYCWGHLVRRRHGFLGVGSTTFGNRVGARRPRRSLATSSSGALAPKTPDGAAIPEQVPDYKEADESADTIRVVRRRVDFVLLRPRARHRHYRSRCSGNNFAILAAAHWSGWFGTRPHGRRVHHGGGIALASDETRAHGWRCVRCVRGV